MTVAEKIVAVTFGDLFLADVRSHRERQLMGTGLEPLFPLWQIPTGALAREMIASGLQARPACVDTRRLPPDFAVREFDAELLSEQRRRRGPLRQVRRVSHPRRCGAVLREALSLATGEIVQREGFSFADFEVRESEDSRGLLSA